MTQLGNNHLNLKDMRTTTSQYGYYRRTKISSVRSQSSVKIHSEERKYYIAITVSIAVITVISVLASYLMPTVPL